MAITTLTPANVQAATEYNYLNSLSLANGLHMPEQSSNYVKRFGRQDMTGLLSILGNKRGVNNPTFSHYEQERIHAVVRLSASAASASGSGVTLAATAAGGYTYTATGQSPYTTDDSFTYNVLQQYDVIEVNGFEMLVTAVNGNAFSAISNDSAGTRPAVATTDDIIIKGTAYPEGSSSGGSSRNGRVISYSNYLGIHRRVHRVTGSEMGTKTWIEVEGPNGKKGYFWYLQGIADEYDRFMNEREMMLMTGQDFQSNLAGLAGIGSASFGDASSIRKTKGLIPQISADGTVESVNASALTLTDIENVAKAIWKNAGAEENMVYCGHNFKINVDTLVRADANLKNGGVQFAAFQGVEDQMVDYGIDAINYGGIKFGFKPLKIFSDPNALGYAGGIYKDLGIVVPMDDVATYNNINSSTSTVVPSIQLVYMDTDDGGREYREWVVGLGNGVSNAVTDYFDVNFLSEVGLECSALNRFALFVGS